MNRPSISQLPPYARRSRTKKYNPKFTGHRKGRRTLPELLVGTNHERMLKRQAERNAS